MNARQLFMTQIAVKRSPSERGFERSMWLLEDEQLFRGGFAISSEK
jgi:hypothetical protein